MLKPRINSPLIVVSNRLPFMLHRNEDGKLQRKQCAGGLVTAVCPILIECKGTWVGWPGMQIEEGELIPESDPEDKAPTAGLLSSQVEPVAIDQAHFDAYYNGCCNGTFWPLMHSMPDRAVFSTKTYESYKLVNEHFAKRTLDALRKCIAKLDEEGHTTVAPLVWIHDYQLMLAASTVRKVAEEEGLRCKMSFFLHIPFPAWDIFRLFPYDDEILEGILGCDLVGFHIDDYCLNFLDCCQRRLGCRVDRSQFLLELDGRTIHIKSMPIGIPFEHFAELSRSAPKVLRERDQQIILGVDRLDYTKGLVNRVKAFERLLEKHPQYLERVTFLQVAVPSRTDVKEYQALKEEMDQLIGCINGRFSKPNWSPIRYIYGCISQQQLSAFYRDSAVALVTPLRDGMNLVAKEYVACQDLKDPGVLLLSPFAGAGGMMHEAILCNPYELDDVADKIHRALEMPFDERQLRMKHLQRREREFDVTHWLNSFLRFMGVLVCDLNNNADLTKMTPLAIGDFDHYLSDYIAVGPGPAAEPLKLSIILDYDGTLAKIANKPCQAVISDETRQTLKRLSEFKDVFICVISGRNLKDLQGMVKLDGITYAASHGLEILSPDGSKYAHPITREHEQKIQALHEEMEELCAGVAGAWMENKGSLLTFHYREVPVNAKESLVKNAVEIFTKHGFHAYRAPMALEAKPDVKWDKGRASIHILKRIFGDDWSDHVKIIYAGDDQSDEMAMEALSGIACTFKVASTAAGQTVRTNANYRLRSPDEVLLMLKWIEKRLNRIKAGGVNGISNGDSGFFNSTSPISSLESHSPPHSKSPLHASISFDESSDDDMRRIRTNSHGRTQNIVRRSKSSLINSAVRKCSEQQSSSPEPSASPPPHGRHILNKCVATTN